MRSGPKERDLSRVAPVISTGGRMLPSMDATAVVEAVFFRCLQAEGVHST